MKYFNYLFLLLLTFVGKSTMGQTNPCPTVTNVNFNEICQNGGICTKNLSLHITNDVSNNPKGVFVEVLSGATVLISHCFIASTAIGGSDFTTDNFDVNCGATLTYRITRYTASNGQCQGGTCGEILLPIKLKNFSAIRQKSTVLLNWQTASEQSNLGFYVERHVNGMWQQITFVPSQAPAGNSSNALNYQYIDNNKEKGITQYRLRQVDIDLRQSFSDIRVVKGMDQSDGIFIYPNPNKGIFTITLDDPGTKSIIMFDSKGKPVRLWERVTGSVFFVDVSNLKAGMYILKISTGSVSKVFILE